MRFTIRSVRRTVQYSTAQHSRCCEGRHSASAPSRPAEMRTSMTGSSSLLLVLFSFIRAREPPPLRCFMLSGSSIQLLCFFRHPFALAGLSHALRSMDVLYVPRGLVFPVGFALPDRGLESSWLSFQQEKDKAQPLQGLAGRGSAVYDNKVVDLVMAWRGSFDVKVIAHVPLELHQSAANYPYGCLFRLGLKT